MLLFFQFHSLAPMYYRGSAAAVIVYDITKLVRITVKHGLGSDMVSGPKLLTKMKKLITHNTYDSPANFEGLKQCPSPQTDPL